MEVVAMFADVGFELGVDVMGVDGAGEAGLAYEVEGVNVEGKRGVDECVLPAAAELEGLGSRLVELGFLFLRMLLLEFLGLDMRLLVLGVLGWAVMVLIRGV